jgi:hypothetical protein
MTSKEICPDCLHIIRQQRRELAIVNVHLKKTDEFVVIANPIVVRDQIGSDIRFENTAK